MSSDAKTTRRPRRINGAQLPIWSALSLIVACSFTSFVVGYVGGYHVGIGLLNSTANSGLIAGVKAVSANAEARPTGTEHNSLSAPQGRVGSDDPSTASNSRPTSATRVVTGNADSAGQAVKEGVTALGGIWSRLAGSGEVFVWHCANNTFSAMKLQSDASISVDVRRTDSLMNPYIGIVYIQGRFVSNAASSSANGFYQDDGGLVPAGNRCFTTQEQALAHLSEADFAQDESRILSFEAYYTLKDASLALSGGNPVFQNAFLSNFTLTGTASGGLWRDVVSMKIQ